MSDRSPRLSWEVTLSLPGKPMDRQQFQRVKEIVLAAEARPRAEQEGFVARACPDDPEVRAEAVRLLGIGASDVHATDSPDGPAAGQHRRLPGEDEGGTGS